MHFPKLHRANEVAMLPTWRGDFGVKICCQICSRQISKQASFFSIEFNAFLFYMPRSVQMALFLCLTIRQPRSNALCISNTRLTFDTRTATNEFAAPIGNGERPHWLRMNEPNSTCPNPSRSINAERNSQPSATRCHSDEQKRQIEQQPIKSSRICFQEI